MNIFQRSLLVLTFIVFIAGHLLAQPAINFLQSTITSSSQNEHEIVKASILNNSASSTLFSIEVSLLIGEENICTGQFSNLELHPGANILDLVFANATSINYSPSPIGQSFRSSGILVPGLYQQCITMRKQSGEQEILAYKCGALQVKPTVITVLYPITDLTTSPTPTFSWLCPSDGNGAPFTVQLWKEDKSGVTGYSEQGMPYFEARVGGCNFYYPLDAPVLKAGESYTFMVSQLINGISCGSSAPLTIKINTDPEQKKGDDFRLITTKLNGGNYVYGTHLRFAFDNRFMDPNLNYHLQDLSRQKGINKIPAIQLNPGLNYIDIDLLGIKGIYYGNDYRLTITDRNNSKYDIQFTFNR